MPEHAQPEQKELKFLISANEKGRIFLSTEADGHLTRQDIAILKPLPRKKRDKARLKLVGRMINTLKEKAAETAPLKIAGKQQAAIQEIRAVLDPWSKGSLFDRVFHFLNSIISFCLQVLISLLWISLAYKGIQWSGKNLSLFIHLAVIVFYAGLLTYGFSLIITEQSRKKSVDFIRIWFWPRGWLIFSALLLVTSAAVFASLSLIMHNFGWVEFLVCRGAKVSESVLLDFYLWHFLKMVPFLKIPEILKLDPPPFYEQTWIGLLIILFQALVVIPSFATICVIT
jgi:hypothetical protein